MLLKVKKGVDLIKSNPDIDFDNLFPKLFSLSENEKKILLLMYDLESPFSGVPIVVRGERVAKYLELDTAVMEGVVKKIESATKNSVTDALKEIADKQSDTVLYIYQSLNNQLFTLSRQIDSIKIDIRDEDDKTFDRFVKFATDSKKIVENIAFIKEQCRDESEIAMLDYATGGGQDNSRSFIDKLYSNDI